MIYSQIKRLLPGNYSIIDDTGMVTPVIGDWRVRQEGTGVDSLLIYEKYNGTTWENKRTLQ